MPIEVRELVVRSIIGEGASGGSSSSSSSVDEDKVVDNCVKQILKILEKKQEP